MRDILIGAADDYGWQELRPWVKSARASGFSGLIYLILYRVKGDRQELLEQLEKYNVQVYEAEHTPYMTDIQHAQQGSPTQAHNLRFYHAAELLSRLDEDLEYCIMTDARDVVFQTNPSDWLRANKVPLDMFIAPSEGITFGKEEWNKHNLVSGFGEVFYTVHNCENWLVRNVGTLAGGAQLMKGLFHTIFSMTEGRYYPADQSSFNVLVNGVLSDMAFGVSMFDNWAAQMGTTNDPTKSWLWERIVEPRPTILNGVVLNPMGNEEFCMVHQWDRVPQLKLYITSYYSDF